MQAPTHANWHDDGYWAAKESARARAAQLRSEAIEAFWRRLADALRLRWAQRSTMPRRVALCD